MVSQPFERSCEMRKLMVLAGGLAITAMSAMEPVLGVVTFMR
jgi:hypothetical protein